MPLGIGNEGGRLASPATVELVSTLEGVAKLENDWNRLSALAEHPNIFATHGWFYAWTKQQLLEYGDKRLRPHVLLVKQRGAVVGVVPLVLRLISRLGFTLRKLEFATFHADHNEFLVGTKQYALTLVALDYLARSAHEWDVVDLKEFAEMELPIKTLLDASSSVGLLHRMITEPGGCLYMPIDKPWSEARRQKHLRFARRAYLEFEERADEGFRLRVVDRPDEEMGLLDRIVAVEAQKRVGGLLSPPFIGAYLEVFQELFKALGPQGYLAVVVVEKGEELVAYRLLFRCGNKLWDYQTAYNHRYSALSPGTLLICEAIDYGFEKGYDEFDFLRGMDRYKQRWTAEFRQNKRLIIWSSRWMSRLIAKAYAWRIADAQPDR